MVLIAKFFVPARGRLEITRSADRVREMLGVPPGDCLDIVRVMEYILGENLKIMTREEMGDNHGLTIPGTGEVRIRDDIYEGACEGNGWYRFTMAHELAHWDIHSDVEIGLARIDDSIQLKAYNDSEWQADAYSGALLMPASRIIEMSIDEIMGAYQVTRKAATTQKKAIMKNPALYS